MAHLRTSTLTAQALMWLLVLMLVFAGFGLLAISTASAQQADTTTTTPTPTPTPNQTGERIQQGLTLLSSEYDGEGTATLVLRSEQTLAVTITDAGGFYGGGELNRRTMVLKPGKHRVSFEVEQAPNGAVGVTVATKQVVYAVPIETDKDWFEGTPNWQTTRLSGLAGLIAGFGTVFSIAWYRMRSESAEVSREI